MVAAPSRGDSTPGSADTPGLRADAHRQVVATSTAARRHRWAGERRTCLLRQAVAATSTAGPHPSVVATDESGRSHPLVVVTSRAARPHRSAVATSTAGRLLSSARRAQLLRPVAVATTTHLAVVRPAVATRTDLGLRPTAVATSTSLAARCLMGRRSGRRWTRALDALEAAVATPNSPSAVSRSRPHRSAAPFPAAAARRQMSVAPMATSMASRPVRATVRMLRARSPAARSVAKPARPPSSRAGSGSRARSRRAVRSRAAWFEVCRSSASLVRHRRVLRAAMARRSR